MRKIPATAAHSYKTYSTSTISRCCAQRQSALAAELRITVLVPYRRSTISTVLTYSYTEHTSSRPYDYEYDPYRYRTEVALLRGADASAYSYGTVRYSNVARQHQFGHSYAAAEHRIDVAKVDIAPRRQSSELVLFAPRVAKTKTR